MSWKNHIPQILKELNDLQQLPTRGLLAGGALANKIWEKVTNKSMPVNDIDIFIYENHLEPSDDLDKDKYKKYIYTEKETKKDFDSYAGIRYESKHSKCYKISEHSRDGLLNFVNYSASTTDYNIIIESFDINCTQVGYDLEKGELIFTEAFDKFIETGDLKVMCANSPAHTLIRILKKRDELSAKLNKVKEFTYLKIARAQRFDNFIRHFFGDKYYGLLSAKWITELQEQGFILKKIEQTEWRDLHGFNPNLWTLDNDPSKPIIGSYNYLNAASTLNDLDFFIRNVHGDPIKEKLWRKFGMMWSREKEYITSIPSLEDEHKLDTLFIKVPEISLSLQGLSFDEQISAIDNLFKLTDKESAICILKSCTVSNNILNEDDILLMSLRARKMIHQRERKGHYDEQLPF